MKKEIKLFKALANETRLRIMVLISNQELCVCQLEWVLGMTQAKISRHLTVLKNAEIVNERRQGLWIFYSLNLPQNELEKILWQYLSRYFVKKYQLIEDDLKNMQKYLCKPLHTLNTIRTNKKGKEKCKKQN